MSSRRGERSLLTPDPSVRRPASSTDARLWTLSRRRALNASGDSDRPSRANAAVSVMLSCAMRVAGERGRPAAVLGRAFLALLCKERDAQRRALLRLVVLRRLHRTGGGNYERSTRVRRSA